MKSKLLILRGRPGSGKSAVAKSIQQKLLPTKVAVLSPDYFYWQVVPGEDNKLLVNQILNFAIQKYLENNYLVILEGILPVAENGQLFTKLRKYCHQNDKKIDLVFLEVSQKTALQRNKQRKKGQSISSKQMKKWYKNADPGQVEDEKIINTTKKDLKQTTDLVLKTLN